MRLRPSIRIRETVVQCRPVSLAAIGEYVTDFFHENIPVVFSAP